MYLNITILHGATALFRVLKKKVVSKNSVDGVELTTLLDLCLHFCTNPRGTDFSSFSLGTFSLWRGKLIN